LRVNGVICEGNVTTAVEIPRMVGVSEKTVRRVVSKLVENGYTYRVGGGKYEK